MQVKADELEDFRTKINKAMSSFKDMKATVVVTNSNRRELEKMGKVFAETYQFKKASVCFKGPDKLKLNGELGMMKCEFVTNSNSRLVRIPSIRFKKREDITNQQEKRMTPLDVGVITDAVWDIYKVKLVRIEKDETGAIVFVLRLNNQRSPKYQMVWIDGKDFKVLRRDRLTEDDKIKSKVVLTDHKKFGEIWVPTRAEVYNGEGKLAASTEMKDIVVNIGVEDKEFE
jgi:outer membrane lipoprotein-sorting protein